MILYVTLSNLITRKDYMITEQDFDTMAHKYMERQMSFVSDIYFDLEVLQDFKFGAALCLAKNEIEYNYIIDKLDEYNRRYNDNIIEHMRLLPNITDADINAFISDAKNHRVLGSLSPWTHVFRDMPAYMNDLIAKNSRAGNSASAINIHIGTSSVKYNDTLQANLSHSFYSINPIIRTHFYDTSIMGLPTTTIDKISIIAVNNIEQMFAAPNAEKIINTEDFFDKQVIAPKLISVDIGDEDPEKILGKTHAVLNTYFQFEYMRRKTILEE